MCGGGTIGEKREAASGSGSLQSVWGRFRPPPREPGTFLTKHNGNHRRKRVERHTIADPKWFSRFLGKKVGGGDIS